MTQKTQTPPVQSGEPPLVIDAAYYERLQNLALGAMKGAEEIASRLLDEIERAEVVPSGRVPRSVVNIGSEVTFRDDETGRTQSVRLVFPSEANIAERRISVLTPIGAALIGLSEGQQISWETRDGEIRRLTILDVLPVESEISDAAAQ